MKLDLKAGADPLKCPGCARENTLEGIDGDTINTRRQIPGAKSIANGLALSCNGYSFSSELQLWVCSLCKAPCYMVQFGLIANGAISYEWANKYFCKNEAITEEPNLFTVVLLSHTPKIPKRWLLYRTETPAGTFDEHCFGPFVTTESLQGPNGVANCGGAAAWDDAAALIGRVWPLLTNSGPSEALPEYSLMNHIHSRSCPDTGHGLPLACPTCGGLWWEGHQCKPTTEPTEDDVPF